MNTVKSGVVFSSGNDPLSIFQQELAASIRNIESHPRGRLFQEFLLKGPYDSAGNIRGCLVRNRLADTDVAAAIAFIYSHMVNCFKGAIAEMLAANACWILLQRLQEEKTVPRSARLYVGDSVLIHRTKGNGLLKGADLHILVHDHRQRSASRVSVAAIAEVKSYVPSARRLREQLEKHVQRARRGLQVNGVDYPAETVNIGYGENRRVTYISVVPSVWKLPRSFRFEQSDIGRSLFVDRGKPARRDDKIEKIADNEWRITLRWSTEALAAAAFEMTYWYMGKVGDVIYSTSVPNGWGRMSTNECGQNAVKEVLYYAILRSRTIRETQRAIALYNSYGYGYALGVSFKNANGRREMLWPHDLDEIAATGKTKNGSFLR